MSYRRAWMLVREINTRFAKPLVFTARGGKGGGGVVGLTPFGEEVLKRHRRMEKSTAESHRGRPEGLESHRNRVKTLNHRVKTGRVPYAPCNRCGEAVLIVR